jgi:hypothetical protein
MYSCLNVTLNVFWKLVIAKLENLEILLSGKRGNLGPQTLVIFGYTLLK